MIGPEDDEEAFYTANIEWLASVGPDDWHRVADEFNWNEPLYILDWIIRQPDCDIATALLIFWKGEPQCWMDEEGPVDEEPNGYSYLNREICVYIADRVRAGGYSRSEIEYIPDTWTRKAYVDLLAHENTLTNPNFRTHPDLILCRNGRQVRADWSFSQRYPERFHHAAYIEPVGGESEHQAFRPPVLTPASDDYERIEYETFQALPTWLQQMPDAARVISQAAPDNDEPTESQPNAGGSQAGDEPEIIDAIDPRDDASSRVRALRHVAIADIDIAHAPNKVLGLIGAFKRRLGR